MEPKLNSIKTMQNDRKITPHRRAARDRGLVFWLAVIVVLCIAFGGCTTQKGGCYATQKFSGYK